MSDVAMLEGPVCSEIRDAGDTIAPFLRGSTRGKRNQTRHFRTSPNESNLILGNGEGAGLHVWRGGDPPEADMYVYGNIFPYKGSDRFENVSHATRAQKN
jgi:hypothetical protein